MNWRSTNVIVAGDSREHALDLVSKMEASQHFHDTYIEEESTSQGNGLGRGYGVSVPHYRALCA